MPRRSSRRPKSFPERVWLGLKRAALRRLDTPWFFPAVGLALIGAMALGMMLGNSTVAAIDPLAFHETAIRPRARLPQDRLPPPPRSVSAAYGWPGGVDCGADCGTYSASGIGAMSVPPDYNAEVPYYGSQGDLDAAVARAREELGPDFPETGPDVGVAGGPIQRYSHFPVTREEAETAAPLMVNRLDQE